jgi:uncharacterized membrane protein YhaH (DUF805 family)
MTLAATVCETQWLVLLGAIFLVAGAWASLAVDVKRWHDRGQSGIMVFLYLVPIVGALWALIEPCLSG